MHRQCLTTNSVVAAKRLSSCLAEPVSRTPLIDALLSRGGQTAIPFHIPGHKRGAGVLPKLLDVVSRETLQYDLTELPGLDYLADPSGPIAESQELAAETFGANKTWYLVNGTSAGLQAAIMATCNPGDTLLIARNCHSSAFAGMALADSRPVWVTPQQDPTSDVAQAISPKLLEGGFCCAAELGLNPRAALIVSPTYFGACSDVTGLAEVCHHHSVPLIVDEAHGAHFGLCPGFPPSAMQQGADIAVQSTHKTLSSMGQSSMLHCKGGRVSQERITQALRALQTTSPSYVLLASLDAARAQAGLMAAGELLVPLTSVTAAKDLLCRLPGLGLLEDSIADTGVVAYDPWRITVDVQGLCMTGFEVERVLQDDYGIFPELATHKVVVFALGPGTQQAHLDSLLAAFEMFCKARQGTKARNATAGAQRLRETHQQHLPTVPQLNPRGAFFAPKEM